MIDKVINFLFPPTKLEDCLLIYGDNRGDVPGSMRRRIREEGLSIVEEWHEIDYRMAKIVKLKNENS